ncbi:MAG: tetratricopeptide repeat protein, partial [Bacteroidota bacterium]
MRFSVLLTIILVSFNLLAQNPYLDSLKMVSDTAEISVRVRAKINLSLAYRGNGEYPLFEQEIREAIKLGEKSPDKKPLVHALNVRGWTLSYPPKVHLDSTVYYVSKGRELAKSIDYRLGLAESYYELGYHYAYFKSDQEDSVLNFFTSAIDLYDKNDDRELNMTLDAYKNLSFYFNRIGKVERALSFVDSAESYREDPHIMNVRAIIYDNTGQYAKAIDTYLQSLSLSLANNDTMSINGSYNNIAAAYGNQGNELKAKEYFLKSWNITRLKMGSMGGFDIVQILRNLGLVYTALDQTDSAQYYFKKAISEGESRNVIDPMYAPYYGMGDMYYRLGLLDSATWYLNKSLVYSEKANEYRVRSSSKRTLGDIAYDKGEYTIALKWYNDALTDAESSDYVKTMTDAYEGIYKVQNRLGNFKEALVAHEL